MECKSDPIASASSRRHASKAILGGEDYPTVIGKFRIVREIACGGMGMVFEGWDDELHRRVAIKLLRSALETEENQTRLLREAQALAKISHPNVVSIYDVGRWNGNVWLAMEYVSGCTLGTWGNSGHHAQSEVVRHWSAVGRGLAAIHDAGMIHHDIKPSNVLLGDDGRVRIVDFGLAKTVNVQASVEQRITGGHDEHLQSQTEMFIGTPAYAAPEVWDSKGTDARSDQYSFCVSMWEALCGTRPTRLDHRRRGLVSVPPRCKLSRRIHRVLSRGLSLSKDDRYPSMHELINELDEPHRTSRRSIMVVCVAALTVVGAMATTNKVDPPDDPCRFATQAINDVWNETARTRLNENVSPEFAPRASRRIEEWANEWRHAAQSSCRAVHIHHVVPESSLDVRSQCLMRDLRALESLIKAFEAGGEWSGSRLGQWFVSLPSPHECLRETEARRGLVAMPESDREELEDLQRRLFAVVGDFSKSFRARIVELEAIEVRANAIGWKPLMGDVQLNLGLIRQKTHEIIRARRHIGTTLDIGVELEDVDMQVNAWSALLSIVVRVDRDIEQARWTLEREKALFEDVNLSPEQATRLDLDQAHVWVLERNWAAAESILKKIVHLEKGPLRADAARLLGIVLTRYERPKEALRAHELARSFELIEDVHRSGHVRDYSEAATILSEVYAMIKDGDFESARTRAEVGLSVAAEEQGPQGPLIARFHLMLTVICRHFNDEDGKRAHAEMADAVAVVSLGVNHPLRISTLSAIGVAAFEDNRIDVALEALKSSLSLAFEHGSSDSKEVAIAEGNLARALFDDRRFQEAKSLLLHATAVLEQNESHDQSIEGPMWLTLALIAEVQLDPDLTLAYVNKIEYCKCAGSVLGPNDIKRYRKLRRRLGLL